MKVAIVGGGRVGTALFAALSSVPPGSETQSTITPVLVSARALPSALSASVYLLCVRDPHLAAVTRAIVSRHSGEAPLFLHTAGGVPSSVLRDAGAVAAAMMHPMVAFAGRAPSLAGALFALQGDERARVAARQLVASLGAEAIELSAAQLPAYHAACVLASNHVLALVALGRDVLGSLGVDPARAARGLTGLFSGVADNLSSLGLPDALTGPIARGDVEAVRRNLAALASHPEALAAYRATGTALVAVAREQGAADPVSLEEIRTVLYAPGKLD